MSKANLSKDVFEVRLRFQLGLLLGGEFELGKLRAGLKFNFIPKVDIELPDDQKMRAVDISYMGLSIVFIIGDRKI